jgi:1,4-alpha-glucan branching enzyme
MTRSVIFEYATGVKTKLFSNARLVGGWDGQGRYSDQWTEVGMSEVTGTDDCPAFRAIVELQPVTGGQTFYWGVRLDGPAGAQLWGIMTEEKSPRSTDRRCSFCPTTPKGRAAIRCIA